MNQKLKKVFPLIVLAAIVAAAFILTDTFAPFWTGFLYGLAAVGLVALVLLVKSYLSKTL